MALEFFETFGRYPGVATAGVGVTSFWSFSGSTANISLAAGRFSGRALQALSSAGGTFQHPVTSCVECVMGMAHIKLSPEGNSAAGTGYMQFRSTGNNNQLTVGMNDLNLLQVWVGGISAPTLLATADVDGQLILTAWNFIEVEYVMHASAGRVSVYLNGKRVIHVTGVNTKGHADADIGRACVINAAGDGSGSNQRRWQDIYFLSAESARLGECTGHAYVPTSDVAVDWTRLSGSTNYEMVDEAQIDSNTTYNSSNNPGDQDLFGFANIVGSPDQIHAVILETTATKDDGGTRIVKGILELDSNLHDGNELNLTDSYLTSIDMFRINPETGNPWVLGDFPIRAGYELVA